LGKDVPDFEILWLVLKSKVFDKDAVQRAEQPKASAANCSHSQGMRITH
jgi:hypothetical protein